MNTSHPTSLLQLEESVFSKRPVLGEIYTRKGSQTLAEFVRNQIKDIESYSQSVSSQRKIELITVISDLTRELLGQEVAISISEQLEKYFSVITADHHGPLTDPGFLNNNLLTGFATHNIDPKLQNILVLACANISFDNDSFPRGHLVHTFTDTVITNQLVFFSRKVRPLTIAFHQPYNQDAILEAKKRIEVWKKEQNLPEKTTAILDSILDKIYANADVLNTPHFSDQVTKTNYLLWKELFKDFSQFPNLVYLEQEQVVNELLLKYHLASDTIINHILFDESYHDLIIKHFDGISGAFTISKQSGTFLFWGLPKNQKYRVQLFKNGNTLTSIDGSYSVPLTPEAVQKGIQDKELIPSTLLSFITLSFYYGLTLVGGGGQTTYATQMKNAYINFTIELNKQDSLLKRIPTNLQAVVYPTLALLKTPAKNLIPATTLDLLLYCSASGLQEINELTQKITFRQAITHALPEIYAFFAQKDEYGTTDQEHIQTIIDRATGFTDIVKPCGEMQS